LQTLISDSQEDFMRRSSSNSISFIVALAILAYFFLRNGALLRTLYRTPPGVVNALAALVGLAILGGGAALLLRWWGPELRGGKEEVVTERPSDLPPGLAGALVSEAILPRHILATLFDLAERCALRISEQEDGSYQFERAEGFGGDLRDFERFLLDKLFDSDGPVSSNDLGEKLRPHTERLAARMRAELAALALIDEDRTGPPANVRMIALAMLFIVFVGLSQMGDLLRPYPLIWMPFAALGLVGVGMFLVPFGGDIRTLAGRRAARRWCSYRRFLGGRGTMTALPGSTGRRFPDAVTFGEERAWARRSAGERVSPSEALNRASEGIFAGLDTASDNLFSMLNHSARALSDSPGLDSLRPPAGPSGGTGFGGPSGGKSGWSSGGSKSRSGSSFSSRSKSSWSGSSSKSRSSSWSSASKSRSSSRSGGFKSGGSRSSSRSSSKSSFRGSSRKK
jgi:hypothetical protein